MKREEAPPAISPVLTLHYLRRPLGNEFPLPLHFAGFKPSDPSGGPSSLSRARLSVTRLLCRQAPVVLPGDLLPTLLPRPHLLRVTRRLPAPPSPVSSPIPRLLSAAPRGPRFAHLCFTRFNLSPLRLPCAPLTSGSWLQLHGGKTRHQI